MISFQDACNQYFATNTQFEKGCFENFICSSLHNRRTIRQISSNLLTERSDEATSASHISANERQYNTSAYVSALNVQHYQVTSKNQSIINAIHRSEVECDTD